MLIALFFFTCLKDVDVLDRKGFFVPVSLNAPGALFEIVPDEHVLLLHCDVFSSVATTAYLMCETQYSSALQWANFFAVQDEHEVLSTQQLLDVCLLEVPEMAQEPLEKAFSLDERHGN